MVWSAECGAFAVNWLTRARPREPCACETPGDACSQSACDAHVAIRLHLCGRPSTALCVLHTRGKKIILIRPPLWRRKVTARKVTATASKDEAFARRTATNKCFVIACCMQETHGMTWRFIRRSAPRKNDCSDLEPCQLVLSLVT